MITPKNITKHELIGLKCKIVKSANPKNKNIQGKIVDETYHTLIIDHNGKDKRVFKKAVELELTLPDKTVVLLDCQKMIGRPWNRIKKKTR